MKRYINGLLIAVLGVSLLATGSVNAESCPGATISNTGAGSVNEIECVDSSQVQVTCSNDIYVVTNSDQVGSSGDVGSIGGTTTGNVISGNATNESGATVAIGSSCAQPVVTAPVIPKTPTPPTPPTGLGAAAAKPKVATLPNTASNPIVEIAIISTLALVATLVISRLYVLAYRYSALK